MKITEQEWVKFSDLVDDYNDAAIKEAIKKSKEAGGYKTIIGRSHAFYPRTIEKTVSNFYEWKVGKLDLNLNDKR